MHGLWEQHMCTWETVKETCHQWRFPTSADVEEMWSRCHFSWHINQLWKGMAFFHGPWLMLAIFSWKLKNKKQNWIACSDGQVIQLIGVSDILHQICSNYENPNFWIAHPSSMNKLPYMRHIYNPKKMKESER